MIRYGTYTKNLQKDDRWHNPFRIYILLIYTVHDFILETLKSNISAVINSLKLCVFCYTNENKT